MTLNAPSLAQQTCSCYGVAVSKVLTCCTKHQKRPSRVAVWCSHPAEFAQACATGCRTDGSPQQQYQFFCSQRCKLLQSRQGRGTTQLNSRAVHDAVTCHGALCQESPIQDGPHSLHQPHRHCNFSDSQTLQRALCSYGCRMHMLRNHEPQRDKCLQQRKS